MKARSAWRSIAKTIGPRNVSTKPTRPPVERMRPAAHRSPPKPPHNPRPKQQDPRVQPQEAEQQAPKPFRLQNFFSSVAIWTPRVAAMWICGHVFFTYGYDIRECEGVSMVPTINPTGQWVIISKSYRRGKGVEVGDIVSFRHVIEPWSSASKRVVGMPGDFVLRYTPEKGDGTMIQVPQGHFFCAGDNQEHSRDSRMFGPIPLALIRGKVIATVWPLDKFGWMKNGLAEPLDEI